MRRQAVAGSGSNVGPLAVRYNARVHPKSRRGGNPTRVISFLTPLAVKDTLTRTLNGGNTTWGMLPTLTLAPSTVTPPVHTSLLVDSTVSCLLAVGMCDKPRDRHSPPQPVRRYLSLIWLERLSWPCPRCSWRCLSRARRPCTSTPMTNRTVPAPLWCGSHAQATPLPPPPSDPACVFADPRQLERRYMP